MTLSDLWPRVKVTTFFEVECRKTAHLKDKVTIAQEETIPNIWNGIMFGDLDWPLNASRGFISISWASCSQRNYITQVKLATANRSRIRIRLSQATWAHVKMASGDPFPRVGDEVDPVKFPPPTLVALISLVALCRRPWAYVWGSNKFGCTGPRPIGTGSGLTPKTRLFLTWVNMPNLISVGQTVRASYRDTPEKLGVI